MSFPVFPNDEVSKSAFRQMVLAANDEKPIVEMTDVTARDMNVIWASIEDVATRWRGRSDCHIPNMPINRKEFWGAFAGDHLPATLPVVEEFIGGSQGAGRLAIDLGCGNSPAAKLLLQRGWRVIAVDNSRPALDVFARQHSSEISSGQLKIVEADITAFTPSEPADLVVAADVLPYIDPSKFRETWAKIHDTFVKENGFFVASLFRSDVRPEMSKQINISKEMGAWLLPDRRMVRPLLTQSGYEIKTCKFRIDTDMPDQDPTCIQFIAQKKTYCDTDGNHACVI